MQNNHLRNIKKGEADPKGQLLFFLGGVRKVQEDNNGKLNPSHFVGPSRSQGHGRPWFSLCYPPELQLHSQNKIAILLVIKGIAIAFVGKFCYI